ncbi:MAG: nucleotidyltransferase family protein [Firmicutes bacterium]|nr:nucleotidyltransferase family protein [Bacillota bacterium]
MFDVIILAGGAKSSALTEMENVKNKAFVQIHGQPMLTYVLTALRQVEEVGRIAIVGPLADLAFAKEQFTQIVTVAEESTIVENVQRGVEALQPRKHVLVCTVDVPFLTPTAVEDLLTSCIPYDADIYYPIINRIDNDRRFPGVTRTYVKLREGEFTGGNLFLVNPACLERALPRLHKIFALRKSPLRLVAMLGFGFVIKLLTKQLSIAALERRFSALFAVQAQAVISKFAEIGTDVDKPSDLELARLHLQPRR